MSTQPIAALYPTTAARTAKHMTAVVFHPSSHPTRRPPMASTTLTSIAADASPFALPPPPAFAGSGHPAILALDLGTTTGWALRTRSGVILSGSRGFRPHRFEGGGMRYLRFNGWLESVREHAGCIDAVYFEEVRRHAGTDAAHVFGGFLASLTAWCEQREIPYEGVPVGTIKRFAAGRGNADKAAMVAAIRARGYSPVDDNEADAIALLLWAIETKGGLA